MRAFLAIPLPEATAAALIDLQSRIPFGRDVPEENLHLTLAFLGEVAEGLLTDLDAQLSSIPLPAAEVRFGALGTFAEMERGLVFIEVHPDPALVSLQSKVAHIARAAGCDLPRRRFRPHVTLTRAARQPRGRARDLVAGAMGLRTEVPNFTAGEVVLYSSILGGGGARHDALARYPLAPSSV